MRNLLKLTSIFLLISACLISRYTECCNESVCGSIVSKCLLMQLCRCSQGNHTCNKECFHCLKDSYSECCSCVELCNLPGPDQGQNSYVGVLENPVPGLFQALAEEDHDWTTEIVHFGEEEMPKMSNIRDEIRDETLPDCTAVFLNNCTSVAKCEKICASMGASGFRWFHDGCCECVGENCFNFGLKESRCRWCSYDDEEMDWEDGEDVYDFSEDNELEDGNDIGDMVY